MSNPPSQHSRSPSGRRAAHAPLLTAGLTRYELVRSLGEDHHGELLLMRQRFDTGPGGYCVIKQLNAVAMEEDWRRLQEEARLLAQLRHPNIPAVHQLHGSAGRPLLLMEYVEGYRLEELRSLATAAVRPLSESFSCYVIAEVAEALHYAYTFEDDRGRALRVVHRDITPHNLLVGLEGEVRVLGFGGARSELAGRVSTEGGQFQGSLAYASPEHAAFGVLDERSDLFSLGVVLLELLTGRHLFGAEARFAAELRSLRQRSKGTASRATGEMGRERTQALLGRIRGLQPGEVEEASSPLPERLRPVVRKMLAPRYEQRFATGAELSAALREYLWSAGGRHGRMELKREVADLISAVPPSRLRASRAGSPPSASQG